MKFKFLSKIDKLFPNKSDHDVGKSIKGVKESQTLDYIRKHKIYTPKIK